MYELLNIMRYKVRGFVILSILLLAFGMPATAFSKSVDPSVYVFQCGENNVKDLSVFSPGVDKMVSKQLVVSCYLIKHGSDYLMWDTGLSDSLAKMKDGLKVRGGAFTLKVLNPLAKQFKELKIDPKSVKLLAFSHMHPDHTGNALLFTNAKILIQREELEAAIGPKAIDFNFNPKSYPTNPKRYKVVGDSYDVFGDGSVKIINTHGHTPGHQSLLINLKKRGPVLLTGDLYHFEKNRRYKRVPSFNFNKKQTLASMEKFEDIAKKLKAEVWIAHDPSMKKLYALKKFIE